MQKLGAAPVAFAHYVAILNFEHSRPVKLAGINLVRLAFQHGTDEFFNGTLPRFAKLFQRATDGVAPFRLIPALEVNGLVAEVRLDGGQHILYGARIERRLVTAISGRGGATRNAMEAGVRLRLLRGVMQ